MFSENEPRDGKDPIMIEKGPWTESRAILERPKSKIEIRLDFSPLFRPARQSGNAHAR